MVSVSLLKLIRGFELFTGEIVAPVSLGGNSTNNCKFVLCDGMTPSEQPPYSHTRVYVTVISRTG